MDMWSPPHAETRRFAALQLLFWASIASFEAFMVPWLTERGYGPARSGLVMAVAFGFSTVGQPLLGSITDRLKAPGRLVATVLFIGSAAIVTFPLAAQRFELLLLLSFVFSLSTISLPAVLDAWIMARRAHNRKVNYGVARAAGSFGFAAGGVLLGLLAHRFGLGVVFPASLLLAVGAAAVSLRISRATADGVRSSESSTHRDTASHSSAGDGKAVGASGHLAAAIRAVVSNKAYLTLITSSFLAITGLRAALTFLPFLIESLGGSVAAVGTAYSIAALSEVPFFVFAAYLHRRVRGHRLISAILAVMALRIFLYTLLGSYHAVLLLQLSHGATFGLFLATSVDYVHQIAPKEHHGFFQALGPSIYFGLGSITGSWLGGVLIEALSVIWLYRIAAIITLIGALLPALLANVGAMARGRG
ncbi:MAG: MFS transporter [Spirochaetales bacterium]|nr:MFS transporter [Spirochaetales bacterium]